MAPRRIALLALATLPLGCVAIESPPPTGLDTDTDAPFETGDATTSGGLDRVESEICEAYLTCLQAIDGELFGTAWLLYGPHGSCFDDEGQSLCEQACSSGLDAMAAVHKSEPACGGTDTDSATRGTSAGTGMTDGSTTSTDDPPDGELYADVQAIFDARCATMGCHDGTTPPQLTADQAHANIVGVPSVQLATMDYVAAGDSANSYLWNKVNGTHMEVFGTGSQMPIGPPLSADDVELIADWIDMGAEP